MKSLVICCMISCFLLGGCSQKYRSLLVLCDNVEETTGLKQDVKGYQISNAHFVSDADRFKRKFFASWEDASQNKWISDIKSKDYAKYFNIKKFDQMYADNLQRWSSQDLVRVRENMRICDIGQISRRAVIVRNTICKVMPTDAPFFENVYAPGGRYPFDENTQSVFRIGLPIFVSHLSNNKEWAFVLSEICSGWVKCADIAYVDNRFVQHYTSLKLGVFIEDGVSICSKTQFHETSNIGMLLPIVGRRALIPVKTSRGRAFLRWSRNKFRPSEFTRLPYKFNQRHVHEIANKLIGNHYAWGGNTYGGRDCSLTIKDFMCVFGRHIPRNSKGQIESQTNVIDLADCNDKEIKVNELCTPFQSIIYMPGHVMLYVGRDKNNRPVFFHNVAGICRFDGLGRFFVGKTILSHGDDTKKLYPFEKTLLQKITKISVIEP